MIGGDEIAQVHLARARLEQHLRPACAWSSRARSSRRRPPRRLPASIVRQRVELELDAALAQRLVGLDERAADVAVLDQPLAERDPAGARVAHAPRACPSRAPRSRRRPRPAPRAASRSPIRPRTACRPGRPSGSRGARSRCTRTRTACSRRRVAPPAIARPPSSIDDHTRRARARAPASAPMMSSAQRLGGEHAGVPSRSADHERADAVGVAEAGSASLAQDHGRERALDAAPSRRDRVVQPACPGAAAISAAITSVSEVDRSDTRRRAAPSRSAVGVRQVAVVAERDRAPGRWRTIGCAFCQCGRAGGRVAGVPDRHAARSACSLPSSNTWATRPMSFIGDHAAAVGDGDARRSPARGAGARRGRSTPAARRRVGRARVDAEDAAHQPAVHRPRAARPRRPRARPRAATRARARRSATAISRAADRARSARSGTPAERSLRSRSASSGAQRHDDAAAALAEERAAASPRRTAST